MDEARQTLTKLGHRGLGKFTGGFGKKSCLSEFESLGLERNDPCIAAQPWLGLFNHSLLKPVWAAPGTVDGKQWHFRCHSGWSWSPSNPGTVHIASGVS